MLKKSLFLLKKRELLYPMLTKRYYSTNEETLLNLINSNLTSKHIKIEDISAGCGSMFKIFVVSDEFEQISRIDRHKIIHKIIEDELPNIHGLEIELKTPQEWKEEEI